jgi:hypothetical protein
VPNYGYILVFDSKYADIPITQSLIKNEPSASELETKKFKINGKIYNKNSMNIMNIDSIIFTQFKELINPDNFGHSFKAMGGTIPDKEVLELLKQIHDYSDSHMIRDIIPKFFKDYVHNRVGTLLTQSEKANINMMSKPNFNKGNLMIYQRRSQQYEWVIYLEEDNSNPNNPIKKRNVITCKDCKYNIESVFSNSLYSYPDGEKILPETKKNMKYDETHIYETYDLDDLIV